MDTTVTGLFPDTGSASRATARLLQTGFAAEQIHIVTADSPDRHEAIDKEVADTKRGIELGLVFGPIAGAVAGGALGGVFGLFPSVGGGVVVGLLGGGLLGLLVGRATTTQVKDEIEHQIDAGTVMVTVKTDGERAPHVMDVLASQGGTGLVATAASYTAAVLPADPRGADKTGRSAVG